MPTLTIHNNSGVVLDIKKGRLSNGQFTGKTIVSKLGPGNNFNCTAGAGDIVRAEPSVQFAGSSQLAANFTPPEDLTGNIHVYIAGKDHLEFRT
jgi:hypothetical protein